VEAERALSSRGWQEEVAADRRGGGGAGAGRFHGVGEGWVDWLGGYARRQSRRGTVGAWRVVGRREAVEREGLWKRATAGGTGLAGCKRARGAGGRRGQWGEEPSGVGRAGGDVVHAS